MEGSEAQRFEGTSVWRAVSKYYTDAKLLSFSRVSVILERYVRDIIANTGIPSYYICMCPSKKLRIFTHFLSLFPAADVGYLSCGKHDCISSWRHTVGISSANTLIANCKFANMQRLL